MTIEFPRIRSLQSVLIRFTKCTEGPNNGFHLTLPPGQLPTTRRQGDQNLRPDIGSRIRWPFNAVEARTWKLRLVGDRGCGTVGQPDHAGRTEARATDIE